MKILSIPEGSEKLFAWVEDDGFYKKIAVDMNNGFEEISKLPMSDYRDYDHFWNLMGKWNPYTDFLIQPPDVELTYENLSKIAKDMKDA